MQRKRKARKTKTGRINTKMTVTAIIIITAIKVIRKKEGSKHNDNKDQQ